MSATSDLETEPSVDLITPRTIVAFLLGDAAAIRTLANNRSTVWVGLLFVMSAAVAREYDGEDLLSEPWYLLIPLAASLATSNLLWVVITWLAWRRDVRPAPLTYRAFLSVYWMTGPLAWVYGIPVERLGSELAAVQLNILFLAIVACWRVVLIIRTIMVLYGARIDDAGPVVLLFADSVMLILLAYAPIPILSFMGGIKSSSSEQLITSSTLIAQFAGFVSLLFWLVGSLVAFITTTPWQRAGFNSATPSRMTRSVWFLAAFSVVAWCSLLPAFQPEQRLRRHVERLMQKGQLEEAVGVMFRHEQRDFPPFWDPPPRIAYHNLTTSFDVPDVLQLVVDETGSWVYRTYLDKLRRQLHSRRFMMRELSLMSNAERLKLFGVLERLPERQEFLQDEDFSAQLWALERTTDESVSVEVRKKAADLRALGQHQETK